MSTPGPGSDADEHLRKCGPFCPHIEFCPECLDLYGICDEHRADPSKGIRWKALARQTQEKE